MFSTKNSPSKYCLDAHPLIWYFTGQKTLSLKAKKIMDKIFSQKTTGYVPVIVLLEIYHLSLKGKKFKFSDFFEKLKLPNIIIVPLDKAVLTTSFSLSKTLNIHDRIICATSLATKSILITKDNAIQKISSIKSVW